ncbi:bifunctional 5,10-methylenetetrahydrofolate dehydrogenase/5,10-methenyltetrahydrofolate cyclohydrolase [Sporosalibacterium faouarense]|uniref:bifunctional 5,10-methylenetetrahydrofolate dehydrogenase/5,10-methenyltetrahydrofolate cyclohydrolase n=1 Tax=Sporosalibacterium faouarense TaxID=516123 RepID=UPI00141C5685|nr:bifunctional 5,10-methylenetetrahydrofolate dehydrogenase/5,10-methenyltetrahydrofolate cyclohydrolase [Sporosalibacterium faouarense]MTI49209.1 bifunctional 5,10-methylenetetrahydrofolate dehydrogenase/5,10-methenyltetrahydrofolate cyclohydrolase [Bacillota bacterium]
MENILKGEPVADKIKENMKLLIDKLNKKNIVPTLGIIRMGNRADDIAYEKGIVKNCESVGIKVKVYEIDRDASMDKMRKLMLQVNKDKNIHGILVFRPLPEQIDVEEIRNLINPAKDIDCMNPINLEKVFEGNLDGFVPCTPMAVMEILKYYKYELRGSDVAVINASLVVGRPLSMMLLGEKATPTICHSKTKNLKEITSKSDIVVTAVGRAKMFGEDYFSTKSVVIDVGISDDGNGGICGDSNYDEVKDKVKGITPVPGGVGSVTTAILLSHVVKACEAYNK